MGDEATQVVPKGNLPKGEIKELTRADILGLSDQVEEEFYIPEWGGKIKIHSLNVASRQRCRAAASEISPTGEVVLNEETMQCAIFIEGTNLGFAMKDLPKLMQKMSGAVQKVAMRIVNISGMGEESLGKPSPISG